MDSDLPTSNTPEFSVTEISGALKRTLEDRFSHIRVRGEVSGYRGPHTSGHVYFDLKDQDALIAAIIWKGVFGKLPFKPQNGLEIIATGKISTFPKKSGYQLIIEYLEPAGEGALLALLEARKKALAAEGLFDPARKQLLPFMPKTVAIITSPTGAVIHDMLRVFEARCPVHILLWPVKVQGDGAEEEITAAIHGFEALSNEGLIPRPDVLILARGGGSLEDLMCFNGESVVRAIAQCEIPTITGVGHETDTTLVDFASDQRATTPTQAAQLAVPVYNELVSRVGELSGRLHGAMQRRLQISRREFEMAQRMWKAPDAILNDRRQRLDYAQERLINGLASRAQRARGRYSGTAPRVSPLLLQALIQRQDSRLNAQGQAMAAALSRRANAARVKFTRSTSHLRPQILQSLYEKHSTRLGRLGQLLNVMSYKSTLKRGFAVVRDEQGHVVRSSAAAQGVVSIEWADGSKLASIK